MILACEKCSTKFLVTAEQLGPNGRKVRCGSCAHVWHAEPEEDKKQVAVEKEIKIQQEENLRQAVQNKAEGKVPSLPSVIEVKSAPAWLKAAVGLLVIFNFLLFLALNKDMVGQTSFYDLIGQYDTTQITIDDVEFLDPIVDEKGKAYLIDWSIKNNSKVTKYLPAMRISLLNKRLENIKSNTDIREMSLKPGESFPLKGSKVPNPGNRGRYLVLEIGNPFDLSLRRD